MTLLTPQQTAIDTNPLEWISPQRSTAMLKAIPTGNPDIGFALLPAAGKDKPNRLADLLRAKLQPCQPNEDELAVATGWPVTAFAHRIIAARNVPTERSIEALAAGYGAAIQPHQDVLAVVLTYWFDDMEIFAHDIMEAVTTYCSMYLAKKGMTSLIVQHVPGEMGSDRRPHVHVVVFARARSLTGWCERPAHMDEKSSAHWVEDWLKFCKLCQFGRPARSISSSAE